MENSMAAYFFSIPELTYMLLENVSTKDIGNFILTNKAVYLCRDYIYKTHFVRFNNYLHSGELSTSLLDPSTFSYIYNLGIEICDNRMLDWIVNSMPHLKKLDLTFGGSCLDITNLHVEQLKLRQPKLNHFCVFGKINNSIQYLSCDQFLVEDINVLCTIASNVKSFQVNRLQIKTYVTETLKFNETVTSIEFTNMWFPLHKCVYGSFTIEYPPNLKKLRLHDCNYMSYLPLPNALEFLAIIDCNIIAPCLPSQLKYLKYVPNIFLDEHIVLPPKIKILELGEFFGGKIKFNKSIKKITYHISSKLSFPRHMSYWDDVEEIVNGQYTPLYRISKSTSPKTSPRIISPSNLAYICPIQKTEPSICIVERYSKKRKICQQRKQKYCSKNTDRYYSKKVNKCRFKKSHR